MKAGTAITNARIQKGTARIRKFLAKKGHLSGRAAVRRGEYDAAKNTVPLTLDVTEGPRVRLAVQGAKFSGGDLKRLLPIYQEGAVDVDLLEEGGRICESGWSGKAISMRPWITTARRRT